MTKMFENAVSKTRCGTTIPDAYDMHMEDMQELIKLAFTRNGEAVYTAIETAFRFGFVMGNRATHSRKLRRL